MGWRREKKSPATRRPSHVTCELAARLSSEQPGAALARVRRRQRRDAAHNSTMSSERIGAALTRALAIVSLCLLPFGLEYGYSVLVIPIQSILTPSSPYALDDSHAVWALAGSLLMAGAALYTGAGAIRRSPKLFLLGTGVGSAIGLALQGVAMALAEHRRGTAIALYYLGQVLFFGPGCGVSFLIALIASIAWMTRLFPSRPGLGSGAVGPCLAVETAVLIWIFYGFNDFGRNDLCKECGEGRVDLFFFVAAAVVGLSQFAAASLWRLPAPLAVAAAPETESGTSTTAAPDKESGTSKTSLSFGDVARSRTFWSFSMVYLVSLLPGFGLKLMSAPIVYFT